MECWRQLQQNSKESPSTNTYPMLPKTQNLYLSFRERILCFEIKTKSLSQSTFSFLFSSFLSVEAGFKLTNLGTMTYLNDKTCLPMTKRYGMCWQMTYSQNVNQSLVIFVFFSRDIKAECKRAFHNWNKFQTCVE